jgi:nucleotide-binding universal stress UspA family protein
MMKIKRLLVPTDFSELASPVIDYAREFTESFSAELHLLHVLESHITTTQFVMGLTIPERVEESSQIAKSHLEQMFDVEWARKHSIICETAHGVPYVQIIRYAREHEIDLILMGTHGRTGLPHVFIGSVAERVVQHAPCPVLTIHPQGHQFVSP